MAPARISVTQPIPEPALARLRAAGRVPPDGGSRRILGPAALREAVRRSDILVWLEHNEGAAGMIDANPGLRQLFVRDPAGDMVEFIGPTREARGRRMEGSRPAGGPGAAGGW